MRKVWADSKGIYVVISDEKFRPGGLAGSAHAIRMDDGGLKEGEKVKAKHICGSCFAWITLSDGTRRYWGNEYAHDYSAPQRQSPSTKWDARGYRIW